MEHKEEGPNAERLAALETLTAIMAELQFQPSDELKDLHRQVITAHTEQDAPGVIAALTHYQELAGERVMAIEDIDASRACNLGLNISTAALWLECNDRGRYAQALEDCCDEAYGLGYANIALQLEQLLQREL